MRWGVGGGGRGGEGLRVRAIRGERERKGAR